MIKTPKILFALLLFSLTPFVNSAFASECYDQSPNLATLDTQYYEFDAIKTFSRSEQRQLKQLFKRLSGNWQGQAVQIDCFGPDNASEKRYKNATIKAKNKTFSNGQLEIRHTKRVIEDRVNTSEIMTLLDTTNVYTFEFLSDNHITFSEKYRRGNASIANNKKVTKKQVAKKKDSDKKRYGSRLIEIIYDLELNHGAFTLLRTFYTNGVYTGEEKWTMYAE